MKLEMWSDLICPFCYLGKHRLANALARFEHADEVTLELRAFELSPDAPRRRPESVAERLESVYGISQEEATKRNDALAQAGAAEGLTYRFDLMQQGNSFDAHRLVQLAQERGIGQDVSERLMRGYFGEGLAIGDPAEIGPAAVEAGLPQQEVDDLLASDRLTNEVRQDERRAHALGIQGVPFLVIDGRYGVSGAQAADTFLQALEHAWAERAAA